MEKLQCVEYNNYFWNVIFRKFIGKIPIYDSKILIPKIQKGVPVIK